MISHDKLLGELCIKRENKFKFSCPIAENDNKISAGVDGVVDQYQ